MTRRNRQLAAIVFTDIVGYASLMREDEARASAIRKRHRRVFDELTPQYEGKILQYYGDGTLSIFSSSVAAVECAVAMQRAFRQEPAVLLRIGIHTGDIAFDDTEVFGDGVNVASRVEPCCVAGGIFLTGKVYDDIKNHEWLSARDLGAFTFKGMDEPVRLFAIDNEGVAVPSETDIHNLRYSDTKLVALTPAPARSTAFIPDWLRQVALVSIPVLLLGLIVLNLARPTRTRYVALALPPEAETSIAVLPFSNFSDDAGNDYFSNGITEDILTLLSHINGLKVVSRTSVMQYKNTEKDIRQIGRELHADHILEGSVRRDGNKVRISAQLIDAQNDHHIWAETYDRKIDELFDVQSQVAQDIALALSRQLSEQEQAEICKKPTKNLQAYEAYLQGRAYYTRYTTKDNDESIVLFREALRRDPSFAQAYAGLGDALAQKAFKQGMNESLLDSAIAMSRRAIALDKDLSEGYKALGLAYHYRGWYDQALQEYHKAVQCNPNNDMAINNIGAIHQEQGNVVEAIRWARRALSINPRHTWSMVNLARMYYAIGQDEECLAILQQGQRDYPQFAPFHQLMVAVFLRQGATAPAKEQALQLIAENPDDPMGYQTMAEIALMEGNLGDTRAFLRQTDQLLGNNRPAKERLGTELALAYIDLKSGNTAIGRTRLEALLPQLKALAERSNMADPYIALAMAHALVDNRQQALQALQRAVDLHWLDYRVAKTHPFLESLRTDPAFRQLLGKVEAHVRELQRQVTLIDQKGHMS